MTEIIKVLIVEDEDDQVEIYTDAIDDYNAETNNIQIDVTYARTPNEAKVCIKNNLYDSAFIDLRLSKGGNPDEGKEIVAFIKSYARYPIYILSGSLDDETRELAKHKFISEYTRGSEEANLDMLLQEVQKLYKTGITKVLNAKGAFTDHLNDIFWNHFSQSKDYWLNHSLSELELEKSVSRYTLSHLFEYFETNEDGSKIKYDVSEMYICPVIKKSLSPGDVVKLEDSFKLVMTPACDLAQGTGDTNIILIKLNDFLCLDDIQKACKILSRAKEEHPSDEEKIKKKEEALKNILSSFIRNNKGNRYHFLPSFLTFKAHVADFQQISTVSSDSITNNDRILTISPAHFKDIQARFASYYARQGSPDFEFKNLTQEYFNELTAT